MTRSQRSRRRDNGLYAQFVILNLNKSDLAYMNVQPNLTTIYNFDKTRNTDTTVHTTCNKNATLHECLHLTVLLFDACKLVRCLYGKCGRMTCHCYWRRLLKVIWFTSRTFFHWCYQEKYICSCTISTCDKSKCNIISLCSTLHLSYVQFTVLSINFCPTHSDRTDISSDPIRFSSISYSSFPPLPLMVPQ